MNLPPKLDHNTERMRRMRRRCCELTAAEKIAVVYDVLVKFTSRVDAAQKFMLKYAGVVQLVQKAMRQRNFMTEILSHEEEVQNKVDAVKQVSLVLLSKH